MKIIKSEIIDEDDSKLFKDGVNTVPGVELNRDGNLIDLFQSKSSSVVELKPMMEGTLYLPSSTANDCTNSLQKSPPTQGEISCILGQYQSLDQTQTDSQNAFVNTTSQYQMQYQTNQ